MLPTLLNDFISMLWTGYFKAHDEQKPIYRSYIKPYLLLARKRAETSSINKHMKFRLILNMELCTTYVSIIILSIVDGIIFDFHDRSVSHHLLIFILFYFKYSSMKRNLLNFLRDNSTILCVQIGHTNENS